MALQIRRGTEAQRAVLTGVAGELLYTTDTKKLYVGDGVTAGGTEVALTGAEIKSLYEAEANAFTDTKNTKLDGIETGATATPAPPGRNRIINGDMRISQRGTVVTPVNGYTLDRWQNIASGVGTVTVSQDTDTPNANIKNSLKIDVTGAVTSQQLSIAVSDKYAMRQQIEGLNVSDLGFGSATAKTVTVSFWVKSPKSGVHNIALCNSGSTRAYVADYTIALADTWEQFSITIAGDTSGTWLTTNGIGLVLHFNLSAGSNTQTAPGVWTAGNFTASSNAITTVLDNIANNFFLANVQLETGPTATEFEYRSYGTELSLCHRYFHIYGGQYPGPVFQGYGINDMTVPYPFPVEMRSLPTATVSGNFNLSNCNGLQAVHLITTAASIRTLVTTLGSFAVFPNIPPPVGKITFSSEL